jgi:hypothetical protein
MISGKKFGFNPEANKKACRRVLHFSTLSKTIKKHLKLDHSNHNFQGHVDLGFTRESLKKNQIHGKRPAYDRKRKRNAHLCTKRNEGGA